jgi:hypothetical protein
MWWNLQLIDLDHEFFFRKIEEAEIESGERTVIMPTFTVKSEIKVAQYLKKVT